MSAALAEHTPIAMAIARSFLRRVPKWVQREDLEQAALIGLWKALERDSGEFAPEQRRAYLKRRIQGAIQDELRAQDWAPRRKCSGAPVTRPLLLREGDLSDTDAALFEGSESPEASPEAIACSKRDAELALRAPLNPSDRAVVELVVLKGGLHVDAAHTLSMCESRVSQRLNRALSTMRAHLGEDAPTPLSPSYQVPLHTRKTIWASHETANRQHRRSHRTTRSDPSRSPTVPPVVGGVSRDRVGGSPAAASDRPVPAGAGGAELGHQTRESVPRAPRGRPMTPAQVEEWNGDFDRMLRAEVARLRGAGKSVDEIALELGTLPEVVDLVLATQAPLRKCGP